ncbi:hypothetical protein CYY_000331 [Polysphondylium violaceum]|uniref:MIF4G domain-containing protein n=1 Tax=Polysphondylium violaceum TaxID=133409 RepID=A0A8J4V918_9MYCE|nr:hypothetical protein CYY_000331 [Polysphondylium violaceum]
MSFSYVPKSTTTAAPTPTTVTSTTTTTTTTTTASPPPTVDSSATDIKKQHDRKPREKKPREPKQIEKKPAAVASPAASGSPSTQESTTTTTATPKPMKERPIKEKKPKEPKPAILKIAQNNNNNNNNNSNNNTTSTSTSNQQQQQQQIKKEKKPRRDFKKEKQAVSAAALAKQKEEEEKKRIQDEENARIKAEQDRIAKEKAEELAKQQELERIEKEKKLEQERIVRLREDLNNLMTQRRLNEKHATAKQGAKDLESNFKRVSNFVKKVKTISDARDAVVTEVTQLNLSQYVSEIIPSILKSNFKIQDIGAIVSVFSTMYQKYEAVDTLIAEQIFQPFIPLVIPATDTENERNAKITKRRILIRLVIDLYFANIIHTFSPILKLMNKLIGSSTIEQDKDIGYGNLLVVLSFVKSISLIVLNKKDQSIPDLPTDYFKLLSEEEAKFSKNLVFNYYNQVCEFLAKEQSVLREKEKEIKLLMRTKGEVPAESSEAYDVLRKQYDKLITNISTFAEMIGEPVPNNDYSSKLDEEINQEQKTEQIETFDSPYENDEQKQFYEISINFPPTVKEKSTNTTPLPSPALSSSSSTTDTNTTSTTSTTTTTSTPTPTPTPSKSNEEVEEEKKAEKQRIKTSLEDMLKLLKFGNAKVSQIDNIVLEFIKLPMKVVKPFLLQFLSAKLDQIPYFSRFLASINQLPIYKDFVGAFVKEIEDDMKGLFEKKDQSLLRERLKDITYIGELIKFRVIERSIAFNYLKLCFDDFSHQNVDVACMLFETCGRYLYRIPDTQIRLRNMLDILIKFKNARLMDGVKETMIDNAYLACRPVVVKKKHVDPIKQFAKSLVFVFLSKASLKNVVDKLLELPWTPETQKYLTKYLLDVHKGKYGNIFLIAEILFELKKYYPLFVRSVIWKLYEDITVGFEKNDFNQNQKRIMQITLFAELYNACLLNTQQIFSFLKSSLEYGYNSIHLFPPSNEREREIVQNRPRPNIEDFDPIKDSFRIRYICTLILTCKDCFSQEDLQNYLSPFLIFFQRYTLTKQLPLEIDFMISDVLSIIPNIKILKNWEEANEECFKILNGIVDDPNDGNMLDKKREAEKEREQEEELAQDFNKELEKQQQERELEEQQQISVQQQLQQLELQQKQLEEMEEEELAKEFKAILQDDLSKKSTEKTKLSLPSLFAITEQQNQSQSNANNSNNSSSSPAPSGLQPFKFLMKKGDKSITKSIDIPEDSSMVTNIRRAKEEQEKNIRENKKMVLKLQQQ